MLNDHCTNHETGIFGGASLFNREGLIIAVGQHIPRGPLGRPKKVTAENKAELERLKAQRQQAYRERIPIEGKFGQGKNGYRLNYIRAKRADTSLAWINSIFLVMNLLILLRVFLCLCKSSAITAMLRTKRHMNRLWLRIVSSLRAQSAGRFPCRRSAVSTF